MGCPSEVKIGANLVFSICTHDPDTGVLTDADALPTYRIYEDETEGVILNGTMTKLDAGNTTGFYTEIIACTVGNGFENGKTYTIYISATVDLDTGGICYTFKAYDDRLTAARAGYLDELAAVNIPADVDTLLTRITAAIATKTEMDTGHGLLATGAKQDIINTVVDAIKVVTDALTAAAAAKIALSAGTIVTGTVSHDNTPASTTVFYSDDVIEATANHYKSRYVFFTSGALQYQMTDITAYSLVAGEGKFTVTVLTEAPADNVTFIII